MATTKPVAPPESQLENMVRVMTETGKIKYISKYLAGKPDFLRENKVRILPPDVKVEAFVPEPLKPIGGQELPEMQANEIDPAGAMETAPEPKKPTKRPGRAKY